MREAGKKKMETQLPHLWNPHKIKKISDKMKLRYKISFWVALALAGSLLWGGSVWLWLAGICAGKFLIRNNKPFGTRVSGFSQSPGITYAGF